MVYFGIVKVDHFSESGLLFSVVAQGEVGMDYTAENSKPTLNPFVLKIFAEASSQNFVLTSIANKAECILDCRSE